MGEFWPGRNRRTDGVGKTQVSECPTHTVEQVRLRNPSGSHMIVGWMKAIGRGRACQRNARFWHACYYSNHAHRHWDDSKNMMHAKPVSD